MSTIVAILEPQADGTLHVPVPDGLRHAKIKVIATLEPADSAVLVSDVDACPPRKAGSLKGTIWMSPDFDEPLEDFKDYME